MVKWEKQEVLVMKKLIACADAYLASRDWKMVAVLKFCLLALGLLLGLCVPSRHKKKAAIAGGAVFALTYIPLMTDFALSAIKTPKAPDEE